MKNSESHNKAELYAKAKILRRQGTSNSEIARRLSIHRNTIARWFPRRGSHKHRGIPHGVGRPSLITSGLLTFLEQRRINDPDVCRKFWPQITNEWILTETETYARRSVSRESIRRVRRMLTDNEHPDTIEVATIFVAAR